MTAAPVTAGTAVAAGSLHPDTQVVTAALHNSIVTRAQDVVNALVADAKVVGIKIVVTGVLCFIAGVVVRSIF